ncbi:MAG: DNA double-strand break repair nuclease NurA [Candidatus Aenigmarchaeota archaeon]|nr:DNA double-strand break repair nuclease NurA [Candidatus Aenigmarchaeota archaeon]MDW8149658.1 DNA double-strand break repair nuclease NurA [Candidatus Aenigmarchaeota archaeon]
MIEVLFNEIINKLKAEEELRKNICEKIIKNTEIKKKIDLDVEEFSVCSVDSGFTKKMLSAIDISIIKTASVFLKFKNNKLVEFRKYPENVKEELFYFKTFSELELNKKLNEKRWLKEVNLAMEACRIFKPDVLLLDGPLLNTNISKKTNECVYENLLSLKDELKDLIIAGIVEDSRSVALCNFLAKFDLLTNEEKILIEKSFDTNITHHLLKNLERTIALPLYKKINFFYLKVSQFDRPLKIEVINNIEEEIDKLSSIIIKTAFSNYYTIPIPIIEADLSARVNENALNEICERFKSLMENLPSLFKLRRDSRPL